MKYDGCYDNDDVIGCVCKMFLWQCKKRINAFVVFRKKTVVIIIIIMIIIKP